MCHLWIVGIVVFVWYGGGATRARRDEGGAVAGAVGNAVDAGGFDGFREGRIRQDRREVAGFTEAWT
jgi:hypothetical protein